MMEAINEAESRLRADRAATTRVPSIRSFLFFFFLFFNLAVGSRTKEDIQGNISSSFFFSFSVSTTGGVIRSMGVEMRTSCCEGRRLVAVDGIEWSLAKAQTWKYWSASLRLGSGASAFCAGFVPRRENVHRPPTFFTSFLRNADPKENKKKIAQQRVGMMRHRSG